MAQDHHAPVPADGAADVEAESQDVPPEIRPITDKMGHLTKSQKLILLLEEMQRPGGVRMHDAMARYGLDTRTMRRYLTDLRRIGVPLVITGRASRRHVGVAPSWRRQGVQLTLLEKVSLHFGRQLFDFLEGTGMPEDMDEALERLGTLAGDEHGKLAQNLDRKFLAVPEHRKVRASTFDLTDEILTALIRQNPADAYYARLNGPTKHYLLHPYTLATYRQGLYLFAFDVEAERVKTFAVDRFRGFRRQRGEHFEYPDDYDPRSLFADAFGIITGPVHNVVLRFNRRAAPYVNERIWHDSQKLVPTPDNGVDLYMRVGLSPELLGWVMSFGPDVQVVAPAEFREVVARLHRQAAALAEE